MRVLIAGGGTGGHIYPALAIAEELLAINQSSVILFVASKEGMEKEIIPKYGLSIRYPESSCQIQHINVVRCLRKFSLKSWLSPLFAIFAFFQSIAIILKFKPNLTVITGGFVGLPVAAASFALRVPVILQEQNVTLGLTNRICSLFAKVVLLSFDASFKYFRSKKARVVGNPVRKNILTVDRDAALASLGLAKNKVKILVLGGSQGARALNEVVCDLVKKGIPAGFEIIHVIGKRDLSSVIAKLAPEVDPSLFYNLECLSRFPGGANYYFVDYLTDISLVLAAADLVVSRAGATVLSEIMARGLPSILVPFPYAAENHQAINAAVLQDMGIAVVLKQDQLNSTNLLNLIFEITGGTKLGQMASAAPKLKPKDAAARIVDIMCQVAKK